MRGRYQKLLVGAAPAQNAFYDLEDDPYELDNRIGDAAAQDHARALRDALANWVLFESPPPAYVDEQAPTISAPNVPPDLRSRLDPAACDARRQAMLDYYERQEPNYLREHS